MKRMLVNATQSDELRVAVVDNGLLVDLDVERSEQEQKKANIYKGRISSIEPSLAAVFVDYGSERHGFLPLKEISAEYFLTASPKSGEDTDIHKLLKIGQEVVIQIDKEERGTKGAALTTFISLAGAFLVLMPNNPRGGGVSRRIEGDERDQLRDTINELNVPDGMSVIIRTAGVGRNKDELAWDLKFLLHYWEAIKQAAVARPAPYLIHRESDAVVRAFRDYLRQDVDEIVIDTPEAFEHAKQYLERARADFLPKLKLYTDKLPLFSRFQCEHQIENAYSREVRLPSGASIVIDQTEALVSIDINSARATKGANIEETALNINLEAADEIARQLRIRDIGGLIVIDFIDMSPARNQREVENRLRDAVRFDRARIQIGRISRFGLLEMSRQRLRGSLNKVIQTVCPHCDGQGMIRSVESIALSIVHLIQEHASRAQGHQLQLQLPVEVATYLINEKRSVLMDIESTTQTSALIIPNPHLQMPNYLLKEMKGSGNNDIPSYQQVKMPKSEATQNRRSAEFQLGAEEPVINQFLANTTLKEEAPKRSGGNGLIKRLWDTIFGGDEEEPKAKAEASKPARKRHPSKTAEPRKKSSRKPTAKGSKSQSGRNRSGRSHDRDGERDSSNKPQPRRNSRGGNAQKGQRSGQGRGRGPRTRSDETKTAITETELASAAAPTAPIESPVKLEQQPIAAEHPPVVVDPKPVAKAAPAARKTPASAVSQQEFKYHGLDTQEPLEQVKTVRKDDKGES